MKVKSDRYLLTKLDGQYDNLVEALRTEAMIHSVVENREQFYMPGGKVTLQLVKSGEKTFLDVKRTILRKPKYINAILEQLGGKWSSSYSGKPHPDKTIELLVKN